MALCTGHPEYIMLQYQLHHFQEIVFGSGEELRIEWHHHGFQAEPADHIHVEVFPEQAFTDAPSSYSLSLP